MVGERAKCSEDATDVRAVGWSLKPVTRWEDNLRLEASNWPSGYLTEGGVLWKVECRKAEAELDLNIRNKMK